MAGLDTWYESAAQATYTTETGVLGPISVRQSYQVDISLSGLSSDTATLQRSYDNGTIWKDVEAYTADTEKVAQNGAPCLMRINKTGTTDTVICHIRAGNVG